MLRKFIICILLLKFSSILLAQDAQITTVEPSKLLHIRFYDAGNIDAIEFKVMIVNDVLNNSVKKAVRLEMIFQNELLMQPKINEFDASEIEPLRKTCDHILEQINFEPLDHYVDILYVCKGGFTLGAFYTPIKKKWTIYLKLIYEDSKSTLHIDTDELVYLKKLLGEIKIKLDELANKK
ncbi:MAG: hypothetical protein N2662_11930 [Bacteroidales bacterium]|nr:hypothetical protein [Bacteroidales bacterium]